MKTTIFYTLLSLFFVPAFAQVNLDHLMQRKIPRCDDIRYNSVLLIPEFYEKGKLDSAQMVLEYWEERCGFNEEMAPLKIMFSIYNTGAFDQHEALRYLVSSGDNYYYHFYYHFTYYQDFGRDGATSKLDSFKVHFARQILEEGSGSHLNELVVRYISGDHQPLMLALKNNLFAGSQIQADYNKMIYEALEMAELNIALTGGVWIPQSNANVLGVHPEFGLHYGGKKKRLMYDLVIMFRFARTPDPYEVVYRDSVYQTQDFFGGFIGFEIGYEFFNDLKNGFHVSAGMGYDGFDALNDRDDDDFSKSIGSFNMNLGLGYRKYFKDGYYVGTKFRYNFVNYSNSGGTNLDGNTMSIAMVFGMSSNPTKARILEKLEYY